MVSGAACVLLPTHVHHVYAFCWMATGNFSAQSPNALGKWAIETVMYCTVKALFCMCKADIVKTRVQLFSRVFPFVNRYNLLSRFFLNIFPGICKLHVGECD